MELITSEVKNEIAELIKLAEDLHEKARKENNADLYTEAAKKFKAIGKILYPILIEKESQSTSGEYQLNRIIFHYSEYHCHESAIAAYKIDHPPLEWDYEVLLTEQKELFYHIGEAINATESPCITLKGDGIRMANDFKYFQFSERANKCEYLAMAEIAKGNFEDALDLYREQENIKNETLEFIRHHEIRVTNKRIVNGNFISTRFNITQTIIHSLLSHDPKKSEVTMTRVIKLELETLKLIDDYFEANPGKSDLLQNQEQLEEQFNFILLNNKDLWLNWMIEFGNNNKLNKLMAKADMNYYLEQKAKLELEKDKLKSFLLTGGFWLVAFCCVMYTLLQIATAQITLTRFLATLFVAPVLMTILGAFILKSTNLLKEENFMKLIALALRINLKGLSWLNKVGKSDAE